jgi:hypothetical protein
MELTFYNSCLPDYGRVLADSAIMTVADEK